MHGVKYQIRCQAGKCGAHAAAGQKLRCRRARLHKIYLIWKGASSPSRRQMTTSNLRIRKPIGLTQGAKILSQLNRLANSALLNLSAVEIQASQLAKPCIVENEPPGPLAWNDGGLRVMKDYEQYDG